MIICPLGINFYKKMMKNAITPKKTQLTKKKNSPNTKYACGGKSGDILVPNKNQYVIWVLSLLFMYLCSALLLYSLLFDNVFSSLQYSVWSDWVEMVDFAFDMLVKFENYRSRSRLFHIYYSPVSTDRSILSGKFTNLLSQQAVMSTESALQYCVNITRQAEYLTQPTTYSYSIMLMVAPILLIGIITVSLFLSAGFASFNFLFIAPLILLFLTVYYPVSLYLYKFGNVGDIYEYTNWLIEETFRLRNLYIDSNFFLTNDSTKGIERFTDLVLPWYVDNGEYEKWGLWISMVDQVDQIREREKYFIMNDLNNISTPKRRLKLNDDGSILAMLDKPIKRIDLLLDILLDIGDVKSITHKSNKSTIKILNPSPLESRQIVHNMWNIESFSPSGHSVPRVFMPVDVLIPERATTISSDASDLLDFSLPQKNNISSDSIQRSGSILDRKQVVYRNNSLSIVDSSSLKSNNRRPDTTKMTNYIFEKTLQNERVREYSKKMYMNNYIKWNPHKYTITKPQVINCGGYGSRNIKKYLSRSHLSYNQDNTKLSPQDLFLDSISRAMVAKKNMIISKYCDSSNISLSPNWVATFNSPTSSEQNHPLEITGFMSKRNLLRLGTHSYNPATNDHTLTAVKGLGCEKNSKTLTAILNLQNNQQNKPQVSLPGSVRGGILDENEIFDDIDFSTESNGEEYCYGGGSHELDLLDSKKSGLNSIVGIRARLIRVIANTLISGFLSSKDFATEEVNKTSNGFIFIRTKFLLFNWFDWGSTVKRFKLDKENNILKSVLYLFDGDSTKRKLVSKWLTFNGIVIDQINLTVLKKKILHENTIPSQNSILANKRLVRTWQILVDYIFLLWIQAFSIIRVIYYEYTIMGKWTLKLSHGICLDVNIETPVLRYVFYEIILNLMVRFTLFLCNFNHYFFDNLTLLPNSLVNPRTVNSVIKTYVVLLDFEPSLVTKLLTFTAFSKTKSESPYELVQPTLLTSTRDSIVRSGRTENKFEQITNIYWSESSTRVGLVFDNYPLTRGAMLLVLQLHYLTLSNSGSGVFCDICNQRFYRQSQNIPTIRVSDLDLSKPNHRRSLISFDAKTRFDLIRTNTTDWSTRTLPTKTVEFFVNIIRPYAKYKCFVNLNNNYVLFTPTNRVFTLVKRMNESLYTEVASASGYLFKRHNLGLSPHSFKSSSVELNYRSWVSTIANTSLDSLTKDNDRILHLNQSQTQSNVLAIANNDAPTVSGVCKYVPNSYNKIYKNNYSSIEQNNNKKEQLFSVNKLIRRNIFIGGGRTGIPTIPTQLIDKIENSVRELFLCSEFFDIGLRVQFDKFVSIFIKKLVTMFDHSVKKTIINKPSCITNINSNLNDLSINFVGLPYIKPSNCINYQQLDIEKFSIDIQHARFMNEDLSISQLAPNSSIVFFIKYLTKSVNKYYTHLETNLLFYLQKISPHNPLAKSNFIWCRTQDLSVVRYVLVYFDRNYKLMLDRLHRLTLSLIILNNHYFWFKGIFYWCSDLMFEASMSTLVAITPGSINHRVLSLYDNFFSNLISEKLDWTHKPIFYRCKSGVVSSFSYIDCENYNRIISMTVTNTWTLRWHAMVKLFQNKITAFPSLEFVFFATEALLEITINLLKLLQSEIHPSTKYTNGLLVYGNHSCAPRLLGALSRKWEHTQNNNLITNDCHALKTPPLQKTASSVSNLINSIIKQLYACLFGGVDPKSIFFWFIKDKLSRLRSLPSIEIYRFDSMLERLDSKICLHRYRLRNSTLPDTYWVLSDDLNTWSSIRRIIYSRITNPEWTYGSDAGNQKIDSVPSLFSGSKNYIYNSLLSGLETLIESRIKLLWLDVCIVFDFAMELATELDFEPVSNPFDNIYTNFIETINEYIAGDELSEERDLLGLTVNLQIGDNPGNEFTTLNRLLDIPNDLEKIFSLDSVDMVHETFGLDSPELGELSPSFDISIPVKSLWLVGVFYYNPTTGGTIAVDLSALCDFIRVLYLDSRIASLATLYDAIDLRVINNTLPVTVLFRLKVNYLIEDLSQLMDLIFIKPSDYILFGFLYLTFLFSYFGGTFPLLSMLVLMIISKISSTTETVTRRVEKNSIGLIRLVSWAANYSLYRFLFHAVANSFIFIRMTIAILILLSVIYLLCEGFHIFSILRTIDNDPENLKFYSGQYFSLERDPFVEKHNVIDDVWDEFKYDSSIDINWSREHFERETTELMGGSVRELGNNIELTGFGKKYDYPEIFELDDDDDYSSRALATSIDQIHNKAVDETSYITKYHGESELEREFSREFERLGQHVPGSTEWYNRASDMSFNIAESAASEEVSSTILNESSEEPTEELDGRRYDLLLFNSVDPNWVYNESLVFSHRQFKPEIFSTTGVSINSSSSDYDPNTIQYLRAVSAVNRQISIFQRNSGNLRLNPIQDMWDLDVSTDWGLDVDDQNFTSFGSVSNNVDNWIDSFGDPLTQLTVKSTNPAITDTISFSHIDNPVVSDVDIYSKEKIILEKSIDLLKRVRLPLLDDSPIHTLTGNERNSWKYFGESQNYLDDEDSTVPEKLDKNDINSRFGSDFMYDDEEGYEYYFDWLFWDISNNNIGNTIAQILPVTRDEMSLETLRNRLHEYSKIEGDSFLGSFTGAVLKESKKQDLQYIIENSLNKYSVFNSNAFYSLSEDSVKAPTFGAFRNTVIRQKVAEMDNDAESRNKSQFFKNDPLSDENNELTPSGDVDDSSSEMWGAFENYYSNGLKTSTSNESIAYSDYSYKFKKKDYGIVYKMFTEPVGMVGIIDSARVNKIYPNKTTPQRDVPNTTALLENTNMKDISSKVSDFNIIGEKLFKKKIHDELSKSFTDGYNIIDLGNAFGKYYKFLNYTNKNEAVLPKPANLDEIRQLNLTNLLGGIVVRENFNKIKSDLGEYPLVISVIRNRFPKTYEGNTGPVTIKSSSVSGEVNLADFISKLVLRTTTGKLDDNNPMLSNKIIAKLGKDISMLKFTPVNPKIVQSSYLNSSGSSRLKKTLASNSKNHKVSEISTSVSTDTNYVTDKISNYVNTFNQTNNNVTSHFKTTDTREEGVNNHILNTILEENFGYDNKMRLSYIGSDEIDSEVRLPRVLATLQDAIDENDSKKLFTNFKKKKVMEFSENYSWDKIDPDDSTEDAEEGDLESHSDPTWTYQYTSSYSQNPLLSSADDSNMYAVTSNSPQLSMVYNNLDFISMGTVNLIKDLEQESFRNISHAWIGGPNVPRSSKRSSLRQVLDSSNYPRDMYIETADAQRGKKDSVGSSSATEEGSAIVEDQVLKYIGGFNLTPNLSTNLDNKANSQFINSWFADLINNSKSFSTPWGLNFKRTGTWEGTTPWDIADNLQELGDMLSDDKYKIYDISSKSVGLSKPVGLTVNAPHVPKQTNFISTDYSESLSYTQKLSQQVDTSIGIIPHKITETSREGLDNYLFLEDKSGSGVGYKYISDFLVNGFSNLDKSKYSSRKIINNTNRLSEYEEPVLDDGDQAWFLDSEANQNWLVNTKFDSGAWQYNFISTSLEQKMVEYDYFSKMMPRNSSVLSSREANNLLWKLKKKNKRIKISSIMRWAQETDDDDSVNPADNFKNNWHSIISSPTGIYTQDPSYFVSEVDEESDATYSSGEVDNIWALNTIDFLTGIESTNNRNSPVADLIEEYDNLKKYSSNDIQVNKKKVLLTLPRKMPPQIPVNEFRNALTGLSESLNIANKNITPASSGSASQSIYNYMESNILHTDEDSELYHDSVNEELVYARSIFGWDKPSRLIRPIFVDNVSDTLSIIPKNTQNALIELYQINDYSSDESDDINEDLDLLDGYDDDDDRYPTIDHPTRGVNTPFSPTENVDAVFDDGYDPFDDFDAYLSHIDNVADSAPDAEFLSAFTELSYGIKDDSDYSSDENGELNADIIDSYITNDEESDNGGGDEQNTHGNFDLGGNEVGDEDDDVELTDYISNEHNNIDLSAVGAVSQDPTDITEDGFEAGGSGGSDGYIGMGGDSTGTAEFNRYIYSDYDFDSSYHPNYSNKKFDTRFDFNPSPFDESLTLNTEQEYEYEMSELYSDNFDMEYMEYDRGLLRKDSVELDSDDLEYSVSNYLDNSSEELINLVPSTPVISQQIDHAERKHGSLDYIRYSTNEEVISFDEGNDVDSESDEYLRVDLGTENLYSVSESDSDTSVSTISDVLEAEMLDDLQDHDDDSHDKELLLEYEADNNEIDFDWSTRSSSALIGDGTDSQTDWDSSVIDEPGDSDDSIQDFDLEAAIPVDYAERVADNAALRRSQISQVDGDVDDSNRSDDSIYISDENDIGSFSDGGAWVLPVVDYYPAQSSDWGFFTQIKKPVSSTLRSIKLPRNSSTDIDINLVSVKMSDMLVDTQQNSVNTGLISTDSIYSDIEFDTQDGLQISPIVTASSNNNISLQAHTMARPLIQSRSAFELWGKEVVTGGIWSPQSVDEYYPNSNQDTREPVSTGEHYLNNESKIIEDILLVSHKKPGFFNSYNFNSISLEPTAHAYEMRWDGNGRHKEYPVDIIPVSKFKSTYDSGRLSSLSAEFDVKYKLISESKVVSNGNSPVYSPVKPLPIESLLSRSEQDDSAAGSELLDTISSLAIPVSKGLKLNKKLNFQRLTAANDYDLGSIKLGKTSKEGDNSVAPVYGKDYRFFRVRKRLNKLLSNSVLHKTRAKNEKAGLSGARYFSYNDNLIPSPHIRSLSIDSNLFNKINSLRVYGSGRLQDYLYRPKLSGILLSSDYFDLRDESSNTWGGEFDELDDDDDDCEEDDLIADEQTDSLDDHWDILDESGPALVDDDEENYEDYEDPHNILHHSNDSKNLFQIDKLVIKDEKNKQIFFDNNTTDTLTSDEVDLDLAIDIDGDEDYINIEKTQTEFSTQPVNTTHHLDEDRFFNYQSLPNSMSVLTRKNEFSWFEDYQYDINTPVFDLVSTDYLSNINYVGRRGLRNQWFADDGLAFGEDSSSLQSGGGHDFKGDFEELVVDDDNIDYEVDNGSLTTIENSKDESDEDDQISLFDTEEEDEEEEEEPEYDWETDEGGDSEEESDYTGTGDSDPDMFPSSETRDQWLVNLFENLVYEDERSTQYVDKFHKDKLKTLDHTLVASFLAATQLDDLAFTANEASMESISRGLSSGNLFESIISFTPDDGYNILGDYSGDSSISATTIDEQAELWYSSLEDEHTESDNPKLGSDLDGDGSDSMDLADGLDDPSQQDYEIDDTEGWESKSYTEEENKAEGDPGGFDDLFQFDRDQMARHKLIEQDWPSWAPVGGSTIYNEKESKLNQDKYYHRLGDVQNLGAEVSTSFLRTNTYKLTQLDPSISSLTLAELKQLRSKNYDYLKDYLLDLKLSNNDFIVGDDDDDGDFENDVEDFNSDIWDLGLENVENETQDSDFLASTVAQDVSDNESAVDLLTDYFSTKIHTNLLYNSLRSEFDTGEVINNESGIVRKAQNSLITALPQSEYKKNLYQYQDTPITLQEKYLADENTMVNIKSIGEHTTDSFVLPKAAMSNSSFDSDYHNLATIARRTTEEASSILPRLKWGSLKKLYLYQLNNNERFLSSVSSLDKHNNTIKNNLQTRTPPISQYNLDCGLINDYEWNENFNSKKLINSKINLFIRTKTDVTRTEQRGYENTWNNGIGSSISPIKLLKTVDLNLINEKTETYPDVSSDINRAPVLWDFDLPSIGDVVNYSKNTARTISDDSSIREVGINDIFSEIDDVLDTQSQMGDDEYDIGEDSDVSVEFLSDFSLMRENMDTLTDSLETAAIPPELISGFISSLKNVDLQGVINESPKSPLKYHIDKLASVGGYDLDANNSYLGLKRQRNRHQAQYRNILRGHLRKKGRIVSNFSIYRKKLDRVGTSQGDTLSRYDLSVFDTPTYRDELLVKSLTGGYPNRILRNNPIYRRSDELQMRTFGPEIQLNSVVWGYGKIDKTLDSNLNSEEDFGLMNGLGYPEIVEQNIYDESDWVEMAYGGSVFSSKFTDFIWKVNDSTGEDSEQEIAVNKRRIDEMLWGDVDADNSDINSSSAYKMLYILSNIFKLSEYKNIYKLPAGYSRFFTTNNQVHNDINSGSIKLTTDDYWNEHLDREEDPDLRKLISEKLAKDSFGTNVGPLGYEEGESLYDNRLLSRGWFPEKVVWDFGERSVSRVGSDPTTLELISNYSSSFSHDMENYGPDAERESLKNVSLNNSIILNAIDDFIESAGIEEDIPYSPAHSEKMWHYFEYESRPNSSKLEERANNWLSLDKISDFEEEEHEAFGPDSDPTEAEGLEYGNFNLLGLNDLISTTRVWSKLDYLGDLDHTEVPGTSLALMENELYDSLRTDFNNFLSEKFPVDPVTGVTATSLPDPATKLFGGQDSFESKTPGFAEYINEYDNSRHTDQDYIVKERAKKLDRIFQMRESDRPKDEFSFAPTSNESIVFEPEWVISGEGWLGQSGSTKSTITAFSIPIAYTDPTSTHLFQPSAPHSIKIMDEGGSSFVENLPYNSLSDFTNNRITRGVDNDSPGFPILRSWSSTATGYASENPQDDWWFDDKTMTDSPFGSDRFSFPETSLTQRDLWWRSFEVGAGSLSSRNEMAGGLFFDKFDNIRDFVISYDYKLYGKSWMNPQSNNVPLKSYSFYNDTELNNYISTRDDDVSHNSGFSNSYQNQLYGDYTYGLFVSSNTNFDGSLVFYSVKIRDYLYYLLSIAITYFSPLYLVLFSTAQSALDQFYNVVHFRSIYNIFTIKNLSLQQTFNLHNGFYLVFQMTLLCLLDLLILSHCLMVKFIYIFSILESWIHITSLTDEYSTLFNASHKFYKNSNVTNFNLEILQIFNIFSWLFFIYTVFFILLIVIF